MKKLKVLAIMLATVLCFCVGAFVVACKDNKKTDPKPTPGTTTDVPVAEGKVTLYFTLADNSVEIPEYGAVFYAGGLTGWSEAGAPAFTKLEGKSVYYVQLEVDNTLSQWDEYGLTLGYNAASGLPADKQGVQWSLKSDECNAIAYPDNMKFEWTEGVTTVNLGTHTFSTALSAPETVDKVELRVTFSEPIPVYDVYFMGGFNGWDSTKAKATTTDNKTYSLVLEDVLCTNYEYKILLIAKSQDVVTEDADGNDLGVWGYYYSDPDWYVEGATKVMARTEISAGGSNLSMNIIKRDNNSYIDLADTVSVAVPDDGIEVKGLDLSKAVWTEGKDAEGAGNGEYTNILSLAATKTLKVEFTEALPDDVVVLCPGGFNGWPGEGDSIKMTISDDRKSATLDCAVLPGDYEFKLCFFYNGAYTGSTWDEARVEYGVANEDGSVGNAAVTVEGYEDGEVALFEEAIVVPALNA